MTKRLKAILNPRPHPLKAKISEAGLRLWQIKRFLGGRPDEAYLSRALNGRQPMSPQVEAGIESLLSELKGGALQ